MTKKNIYNLSKLLYFIIIVFIFNNCSNKNNEISELSETVNYIHISHTRTNSNPLVDSLVATIDFKKYEMLWLGGDIAFLNSESEETMNYLNSIFNFGSSNTIWSLGNHDYTNLQLIESYTNRNSFYTFYKNGISFFVMDTQDSLSNIIGEQKEMFDNLIDTIQNSRYLIIMHHKLIWMYNHPFLETKIDSISNGELGNCFYCINPNNFYTNIYSKLKIVKQKGIEVICIAGDIGKKVKDFQYITEEGIYFLASGINSGTIGNKALVFEQNLKNDSLSWKFELLTDL